jgi:hypothetical protein
VCRDVVALGGSSVVAKVRIGVCGYVEYGHGAPGPIADGYDGGVGQA